jgi:hypothetical protein
MTFLYEAGALQEDRLGSLKNVKAVDQTKLNAISHLERAFIELYYAHAELMLIEQSQIPTELSKTLLKAKNLIETACVTLSSSNTDVDT